MKTKKTSTSVADKTSKKQDTFRTFGTNLSDKAKEVVEKLLGYDDDPDACLDAIIYLYSKMPDADPQYLKIFYSYDYNGTWIKTISEEELNILQNELKYVVLYCFHKINQRDRGNYTNSYWWQNYGDRYKSQELKIDAIEEGPDYTDYSIDNGVFCTMLPEVVELCYKLTNPVPCSTIFLPFAGDSQFATYRNGYKYEGFELNPWRRLLGEILIKMCGIDAEIAYYETPQQALSRNCEKRYDYIFTYLPFFDKVYDEIRENLKNQFFDLMAQLNDGGAMCCILPYTVCFSYEWKDFRKRFIENEGQYSATIIVLPHRNDMEGFECLFVINKDGQGAITLLDARAEKFLISHSISHHRSDGIELTEHYTMNVKAICDVISVGKARFSDVEMFSSMFSDLDEKLGLIPYRYATKASDDESKALSIELYKLLHSQETQLPDNLTEKHEYGEILGNLIDIVTDNNTDNPEEEDKCSFYSSYDLTLDWFNCDLPERLLDERPWRSKLYRLDRNCLLCVWDGEQFRVGKLRGVNAEQIVYLETGIVPIRIKSDAISEKYLLMSLTSNPTQLIGVNSRGNQLDEEDFLSIWIVVPSKERQEQLCEEALKTRVLDTEQKLQESLEDFRNDVHMKTHDIGHTLLNLHNWWEVLQSVRAKNEGFLSDNTMVDDYQMSKIYDNIEDAISEIQEKFKRFDRGNGLGRENIVVTEFIENYISSHYDSGFRYDYDAEAHYAKSDVPEYSVDEKTGKAKPTGKNLINEGDPLENIYFPKEALNIIFDNIVANARAHGFKNRDGGNNVIHIELSSYDPDCVITISNNGHPIPENEVRDIFVWGKTTCGDDGHSGIGGYEIRNLMREFGGEAEVICNPDTEFKVSYKLTFHNVQPDKTM